MATLIEVDASSPTLEDLVDKTFYGLKMNPETGQAYIDVINGDAPISLPGLSGTRSVTYLNWLWSYNTFIYNFNSNTGRLLLEVL
jgi:hypothetical protein